MKRENHIVYFIEAIGVNAIKIGLVWTRGEFPYPRYVEQRMKDLQASCPLPLALIGITTKFSEKTLHEKFSLLNIHGEWFEGSTELRQFIKLNANPASQPGLPDYTRHLKELPSLNGGSRKIVWQVLIE